MQFDGVDDAVEIAHQSALAPAALSLEAWVLPDETSPTANRMIVGKTSNGNDGYGLHQVSGGLFARFWVNKASDAATGV
ncbi:MAG: LamG-like jellyroll fold domain-containing protein, partial [bacterium]